MTRCRHLTDNEIHNLPCLLSMLEKVFLSMNKDDERLWSPDPKVQFSVKSFYDVLHGDKDVIRGWKRLWNKLVLPQFVVFCWLACLQKILTVDKLKRRGHILVHRCTMWLADEETSNTLFIHCCLYTRVWVTALSRFGMNWVMPQTISLLSTMEANKQCVRRFCGIYLCLLVYEKLWLEQNSRTFSNKSTGVDEVVASIVWTVSAGQVEIRSSLMCICMTTTVLGRLISRGH